MELAAPAITPWILRAVDCEPVGHRHLLAPHRVAHDLGLQLELVRVLDMLQLAAAALPVIRTWRLDAVAGRLDDGDRVREPHPPLAVLQLHLDALTGKRKVTDYEARFAALEFVHIDHAR